MEITGRLNLYSKLYQKSIFSNALHVANGGSLKAPILVEIDTTSYCDFECPECVSSELLNKKRFSNRRLIELAYELIELSTLAVIFVGGGEPLAHKAIGQVIEILGKANIKIGVITNGLYIDRYLEVLSTYTDWIRVSVDASCEETFQIFRPHKSGKNYFDRIINNMRQLKSKNTKCLGYSFLLMTRYDDNKNLIASNYNDLYNAGILAKEIGCDYFEVKPVFDPTTHRITGQSLDLIEMLESNLLRLRKIEDEQFKVIYPQALIELLTGNYQAKLEPYGRCYISELRTLITPNNMYICPLYRGKEEYSFGDISDSTLLEVWNSDQRISLFSKLNPYIDCLPKCSRHLSNLEIFKIKNGHISNIIWEDFDLFI